MIKPALSKAELRAQLEAAVADCRGAVTYCTPGAPPERLSPPNWISTMTRTSLSLPSLFLWGRKPDWPRRHLEL